jgi:DnaJ-class molecular chaperone
MGKLKPTWPQVNGFKVKMVHVSVECPECGGKRKRSCDTCGPKGIVEKWVSIEDLKRSLKNIST